MVRIRSATHPRSVDNVAHGTGCTSIATPLRLFRDALIMLQDRVAVVKAYLEDVRVRGVPINHAQDEYGGCVAWKANLAVVLAGGVFNTFDLLVETGIGPEKYLKVREVPEDWWTPNEDVGQGVGDEHSVVFVGAEPETADPYGAQPTLIAEDTHGSAYEF